MMDIVKKNILSIICAVIALMALIAAFYPLGGYVEELQGKLNARKSEASSIESMITKQRQLPVVNPDSTETEQLTQFPTEAIIKQGEAITKQVAAESLRMRDAAVKMNVRQLMLPESLPDAQPGKRIEFRERYRIEMPMTGPNAAAANNPLNPTAFQQPPLGRDLRGAVPASPAEITKAQTDEATKIEAEHGNVPGNKAAVESLVAERRSKIPDEMQTAVAQKAMIYVDPNAFDVSIAVIGNPGAADRPPDPVNIFLAQLGYWVQKDIVAALNETNATPDPVTNAAPKNVTEAPVKRLHKIVVAPFFVTGAAPGTPPTSSGPDAPLPKMTNVSPTGRVSNDLFDVVHFTMLVDVEAEKVPLFLQTLGKNRFMNAMVIEFKTLDGAKTHAEGFRYGSKPVITMNVQCETLYFRQWTTPYMPLLIKQQLGLAPAPAAIQ